MLGIFESARCPIGVDMGAHGLRLLQFRTMHGDSGTRRDGLALQAAARLDRAALGDPDDPHAWAAAVRQAVADGGFRGRDCVLALPAARVPAKSIRLPQMPDADLYQALTWEVKDRFGFELGEGQLAWFRAGEVRRGTETRDELLVFAAPGPVLRGLLEGFDAVGLRVRAIDLAPCAMVRAIHRVAPVAAEGPQGIMDIGSSGTQFLICQEGRLVFYKHIEIGSAAIDGAIAQKLGVSGSEAAQMRDRLMEQDLSAAADDGGTQIDGAADTAPVFPGETMPAELAHAVTDAIRPRLDELARELDMCMRYFVVTFRGVRPELLSVVGRQGHCGPILESLSNTLGLRVEPAHPLREVADLGEVARPDRSAEWAVAAGLSLYPLGARAEAAA